MNQYKFVLKELLDSYPTSIKKNIKEDLIHLLKISEKTLERIMYAKQGDKQYISGTNLIIISEYFEIQPKEFYTYTLSEELEDLKNIVNKLGLVR